VIVGSRFKFKIKRSDAEEEKITASQKVEKKEQCTDSNP
jgi:hypothetical protein